MFKTPQLQKQHVSLRIAASVKEQIATTSSRNTMVKF